MNIESNILTLSFNKDLYLKEALLKAAYRFIDICYIYINQTDTDYIVEITAKEAALPESLPNEIKNELLSQTVRLQVYKQTHVIRELLMARAMASTIINETPNAENDEDRENTDIAEIIEDWFEGLSTV